MFGKLGCRIFGSHNWTIKSMVSEDKLQHRCIVEVVCTTCLAEAKIYGSSTCWNWYSPAGDSVELGRLRSNLLNWWKGLRWNADKASGR